MPLTEHRQFLREEVQRARAEFHAIRSAIPEQDWRAPSLNPGWTNGEVMFHIALGFIVGARLIPMLRFWSRFPPGFSLLFAKLLNVLTPAFNVINAVGARGGARVYSQKRIGRRFDRACASILASLSRAPDDALSAGMYYPTRWDALFSDFMTLTDVVHFPVKHFRFHAHQLAPGRRSMGVMEDLA
jgi:hypothetical protein